MTAADTVAEPDASSAPSTPADTGPDSVARAHAVAATLFFVIGALVYLAVAAKLVEPGFLSGSGPLSYGRLLPVSYAALLYGWLGLMAVAAAYYMVPRLVGAPLAMSGIALLNLLVIAGGIGAGAVAVSVGGQGAGGRYLELPLWSDVIVAVGFLVAAVVATRTAAARKDRLPTAAWYLVGALWWYVIGYVAGMLPIFSGIGETTQNWFAVSILAGVAPAAAGIGIGYFLIARYAGELHPSLGVLGFWSVAALWVWTAPRYLQYGPTNDWLETVPVVFSAGLIVAIVVVVADMAYALRGRFQTVRRSVPLTFFFAGMVALTLVPVLMLVQSFRGASAVIHLTAWETGFEQLTILGAFSLMAFAAAYHLLGVGGYWRRNFAGLHVVLAGLGIGIAVVSRFMAGLQVGYTWVGGVNSQGYENAGQGFVNSTAPIEGLNVVQLVGLAIFFASVLPFFAGVIANVAGAPGEKEGPLDDISDAPVQGLSSIVQGVFALTIVAGLAVVVTPMFDAGGASPQRNEPSILAEQSASRNRVDAENVRGYELYVSEGCWYCHTQQVRAIVTDVGLGPVSVPGDYYYDDADVIGLERIGPDLTHAGSRQPTNSRRLVRAHLLDPRDPPGDGVDAVRRPWSTMPSYDYLSDEDIRALAAYVTGLE
ncbi:MAG TPA: cbb3-type cytochrome c oxidase subunit I [Acidimicrobiia bacterium]|nr:cbb3-type cytochrome c oxidase subunit I [Acidimicrobiia bacterium]